MLYGGTELFEQKVINHLRNTLEFGTENSQVFTYIGMNVCQNPDKSIVFDQFSFAESILPIELSRERLMTKSDPLTDSEITKYRSLIGQLNWLANISHPEIDFEVCQASTRIKSPIIVDIINLNKVVYKVKKERSFLTFPQLDWSSIHLKTYQDASYNNLPDGGSQGEFIVFLCDKYDRCAPISWGSTRIKRIVRSTLAAETLILNDGCDEALYTADLLESIQPGQEKVKIIAITDNKSAVEAIKSSTQVSDRNLRVGIAHLREYHETTKIKIHHVQGQLQLADVFTKRGVSNQLLLSVLQKGKIPTPC